MATTLVYIGTKAIPNSECLVHEVQLHKFCSHGNLRPHALPRIYKQSITCHLYWEEGIIPSWLLQLFLTP